MAFKNATLDKFGIILALLEMKVKCTMIVLFEIKLEYDNC